MPAIPDGYLRRAPGSVARLAVGARPRRWLLAGRTPGHWATSAERMVKPDGAMGWGGRIGRAGLDGNTQTSGLYYVHTQ